MRRFTILLAVGLAVASVSTTAYAQTPKPLLSAPPVVNTGSIQITEPDAFDDTAINESIGMEGGADDSSVSVAIDSENSPDQLETPQASEAFSTGESAQLQVSAITLSCNPVEYGTPVTTTETVPLIAIIALDPIPAFPVNTGRMHDVTHTAYGLGWLAPDPGFSGDLTIWGIDQDGDCVRDDVENFIYRLLQGPNNISKRKYLFEYAKWLQNFLESNYGTDDAIEIQDKLLTAAYCADIRIGNIAYKLLNEVFIETHNTYGRIKKQIENVDVLAGQHTRNLGARSCP